MDKLKMYTENKVDKNIDSIGRIFPNAITELIRDGKVMKAIDFDVLKQELSNDIVEGREERYQFTWPDKKKSILLANAPIAKTLRPCRKESVDFDNTENLYIEGDNLDVLKILQETYLGKVKMIYIDPPYNTGNDFVYEDDYSQSIDEYIAKSGQNDEEGNRLVQNAESNGRFHTDWLNMMYPRIRLAKDLLTEDGVIFISIDDNEMTQLKMMCDSIFNESNCIGVMIQNKQNAKNDTIDIQKNHEYILAYRKQCNYINNTKIKSTLINISVKEKVVLEEDGKYYYLNDSITTRGEGGVLKARKNLGYTVYYNPLTKDKIGICDYDLNLALVSDDEKKVYTDNREFVSKGYFAIRPPKVRGQLGCWTWELDKFNRDKQLISIVENESTKSFTVKKRTFVDKSEVYTNNGKLFYKAYTEGNTRSIIDFSTNDGSIELSNILGKNAVFNNPKNVEMIKYFLKLVPDKDALIFDFFSGSATTAQAVMELNVEDGGKRKFVLVQLPEETDKMSEANKNGYNNICEIGKERIRRVGDKIKEEYKEIKINNGFRVLKVDSTNMKDVYYNPAEFELSFFDSVIDNIKEDRSPEDLLFQVMLDLGVLLSSKIVETKIGNKKVFDVADGFLIACFDDDVTDDVVKSIAQRKPYYAIFRDRSIATDSVAANFDQIFATYSPSSIRKVL